MSTTSRLFDGHWMQLALVFIGGYIGSGAPLLPVRLRPGPTTSGQGALAQDHGSTGPSSAALVHASSSNCVWTKVPSPNTGSPNNCLFGVAAIDSNDVWAVGAHGILGIDARQLIQHWDGFEWKLATTPLLATSSELLATSAVAADDVWAVGGYNSGGQALIEHWNGTNWTVVSHPNPGGFNRFYGVAAISSQNVWAVGQVDDGGLSGTLVEHWDGASWSVVPSPNIPNQHNKLNAVTAVPGSPNELWAVGQAGPTALILHWDGTQWNIVPSPSAGPVPILTGVVAVSSDDVWAVGWTSAGSGPITLTEHWDGSSWSRWVSR